MSPWWITIGRYHEVEPTNIANVRAHCHKLICLWDLLNHHSRNLAGPETATFKGKSKREGEKTNSIFSTNKQHSSLSHSYSLLLFLSFSLSLTHSFPLSLAPCHSPGAAATSAQHQDHSCGLPCHNDFLRLPGTRRPPARNQLFLWTVTATGSGEEERVYMCVCV